MLDLLAKDDSQLGTKDRISIVTFRLLNDNANSDITINRICKAAGITKSTFYYYYHSIDEVIESFSEIVSMQLSNSMPEIFEQKTCVEQALLAIKAVDTGVEQLGPAVAASRYAMHLKKGDYPGFSVEAGWSLVLAIITKAIAIGEIPNDRSPEEVTSSLYYIMRGVNHTWCMQGGNFNFTETVQNELKIYFKLLQNSVRNGTEPQAEA